MAATPATWVLTRLDRHTEEAQATCLAQSAAATILHRRLSGGELAAAVPLARYSTGVLAGAAYGCLAGSKPSSLFAAGLYGASVWLAGLLLLPVTRGTARGLAAHVAFGFMMELARRTFRPLL